MGCDIHAYVEYKYNNQNENDTYWYSLTGQLSLPRHYVLFGLIAQVRGEELLFSPKGIPENLGFSAQDDWYLLISEDENANDIEGYTSLANAQRWEKSCDCKIVEYQGKPFKVEHPDWHTPTWLTPSELRQALKKLDDTDVYNAILVMMEALEKEDKTVRMVIWFDN